MSTDRFPDAHLHDLAKLGDGRADSLVAELGDELVDAATREGRLRRDDRSDLEKRRSVFPQLLREIARDVDSGLNPALKGLLLGGGETGGGDDSDGDIGPKIDEMRVRHAQSLFEEHGLPVVTALFHAALPEAYLGRRGVQVLDITGELVSNWTRRIRETGQFLINVLSPTSDTADAATSLSPGQPAAIAVRRVRLTHAAVRWLLLAPDESEFAPLTLRNFSGTPNAWQRRLIDVGADSGGNARAGHPAGAGEGARRRQACHRRDPERSRDSRPARLGAGVLTLPADCTPSGEPRTIDVRAGTNSRRRNFRLVPRTFRMR
jgi:hypothetical protein